MDEQFEFIDFTNASEWEQVITTIEQFMKRCDASKQVSAQDINDNNNRDDKSINFWLNRRQYCISYEQLEQSSVSNQTFFNDYAHLLHNWTSLTKLYVISGVKKPIADLSELKLVQSTAVMAASSLSGDYYAIFVQTGAQWKELYDGLVVSQGMVTSRIRSTFAPLVPREYRGHTQLQQLFKNMYSLLTSDIKIISAQKQTFTLKFYGYDLDANVFAFTAEDPIQKFYITLSESTFDSKSNQQLYLFQKDLSQVDMFLKIDTESVPDFNYLVGLQLSSKIGDVIQALTSNSHQMHQYRSNEDLMNQQKSLGQTISDKVKNPMGNFEIVDIDVIKDVVYKVLSQEAIMLQMSDDFQRVVGSVDQNSLLFKMCYCSLFQMESRLNMRFDSAIRSLWHLSMNKVRDCWNTKTVIPHVGFEINQQQCLIAQKLTLINHCIKSILRQGHSSVQVSNDNGDDLFFDTNEHFDNRGIVKFHPTLHLINHPDERLAIPITQHSGVMTSDMVEEQMRQFEDLGDSGEAADLRAKMQSAHLLSDMSAFKFANPLSSLVDFVRWHSPRDYVDGQLSARMQDQQNLWNQLWLEALPLHADQQEQLFDLDKEGERALADLQSISDPTWYLIPTYCSIVVQHLSDVANGLHLNVDQSLVCDYLSKCTAQLQKLNWPCYSMSIEADNILALDRLQQILLQIRQTETILALSKSILDKFGMENIDDIMSIIQDDYLEPVSINGCKLSITSNIGAQLINKLKESNDPSPLIEEFVFTVSADDDTESSQLTHEFQKPRLYAEQRDGCFRLVYNEVIQ
ncbi:hypothetical protein MP228_003826 [Amoeboaphelidium protococcarum]|nr:hypothetical protein MP228_003826 [Amoeboaphelidium protococcarum]